MADNRIQKLTWAKVDSISSSSNAATLEVNNSILYGKERTSTFGRKPYLISKEYVPVGQPYDYLAMMGTKFELGVNNTWVTQRKPYLNKDYSMMLTQSGVSQGYLPTRAYLVENSTDAIGVYISGVESKDSKTKITLKSTPNAIGSYKLFAEDTAGNKIDHIVFTSAGGRIFTVKNDDVRYELVKYPKSFSGGSDVIGRHYLWNCELVSIKEWEDGGKSYRESTEKIQYTPEPYVEGNWVDYGDELTRLETTEIGADPYYTITGYGYTKGTIPLSEDDASNLTVKYSILMELFTTTPELNHIDVDGITVYYGNLDVGVFEESSSYVYRLTPSGTTVTALEQEYYYYNPNNQCFLSITLDNGGPPVTCKYHGIEDGVDFEREITVNSTYARYFYYSNRG